MEYQTPNKMLLVQHKEFSLVLTQEHMAYVLTSQMVLCLVQME
jgi:hypothetical protein